MPISGGAGGFINFGGNYLTVPPPAIAAGYTQQILLDQFNNLGTTDLGAAHQGKNWYIDQAPFFKIGTADYTAADPSWFSVASGILTVSRNNHSGGAECCPISYTGNGTYTGRVLPLIGGSNGGYVEGRLKFSLPATDTYAPNFWLLDVDGILAQMDGGGTFRFAEVDIVEATSTQGVLNAQNWTGWNTNTAPYSNTVDLTGLNYGNYHTWGVRWKTRAQNGGTGILEWFVDGISRGTPLTWVNATDVGCDIEWAQFLVMFSAGDGANNPIPLNLDYIGAWTIPGFYSSQVAQFFGRITDPGVARKTLYAALIDGLVADGVWDLLDALWMFAADIAGNALVNLKSVRYTATANGSPTFTANQGYTGVDGSTTVYIDTGFNPSSAAFPRFTQNSAAVFAFSNTNAQAVAGGAVMGVYNGTNNASQIFPKFSDGNAYYRINEVASAGIANSDSTGFYVSNRSASGTQQGYRNTTDQGVVSQTSTTAGNGNIYILAQNTIGTGPASGGGYQVCCAGICSSLTSTQETALYNRIRTYLTAVGVP